MVGEIGKHSWVLATKTEDLLAIYVSEGSEEYEQYFYI
jgi:hypothetical protein